MLQHTSVILVFMALLWANTVSFYMVLNTDFELVELFDFEDTESEKEGKEDKDDKIQSISFNNIFTSSRKLISTTHQFNLLTSHHQEIKTPPPEFILSNMKS